MSQLDLQKCLTKARYYMDTGDFERVFELADDTIRQINRYGTPALYRTEEFQQLMVCAWVSAVVYGYNIKRHLKRPALDEIQSPRPSPYLRHAVHDPHGLYWLWGLSHRYMQQAGHKPGAISAVSLDAQRTVRWYVKRSRRFAAPPGRKSRTQRFLDWLDQLTSYENVHYLVQVQGPEQRLVAITP